MAKTKQNHTANDPKKPHIPWNFYTYSSSKKLPTLKAPTVAHIAPDTFPMLVRAPITSPHPLPTVLSPSDLHTINYFLTQKISTDASLAALYHCLPVGEANATFDSWATLISAFCGAPSLQELTGVAPLVAAKLRADSVFATVYATLLKLHSLENTLPHNTHQVELIDALFEWAIPLQLDAQLTYQTISYYPHSLDTLPTNPTPTQRIHHAWHTSWLIAFQVFFEYLQAEEPAATIVWTTTQQRPQHLPLTITLGSNILRQAATPTAPSGSLGVVYTQKTYSAILQQITTIQQTLNLQQAPITDPNPSPT